MRERLKNGICQGLVDVGVASLARRRHSGSAVILAYHNIVPEGETADGETGLHLAQVEFARQLDLLSETHEVVGLGDLLSADGVDRPRAAITFDDAYRGSLRAGLEELRRRDLPATYFVCPGLLDQSTFWWDAIAAGHWGVIPDGVRRRAMRELEGRQEKIVQWARREGVGLGRVPEHCRSGTAKDLVEVSRQTGITIGSHTWSHPNLRQVDADVANRQVSRARAWLARTLDQVIPWLAYPYGIAPEAPLEREFDRVERALTIDARLIDLDDPELDPMLIPRINIPASMTLARFELLISGI